MKKLLKIYVWLSTAIVTVGLGTSLWFVATTDKPENSKYSAQYRSALEKFPAQAADDRTLLKFSQLYGDLTSPELAERVNNLYADRLYFNDTFNTFENRAELRAYLLHTAANLMHSQVLVDDIARNGNEVYVRWTMTITTKVKQKTIVSESIGITHLRFNKQGKVVLHQDYWDGIDGFYQHLPYVGLPIKMIREKL